MKANVNKYRKKILYPQGLFVKKNILAEILTFSLKLHKTTLL